jgi:general secretion pathway protein B
VIPLTVTEVAAPPVARVVAPKTAPPQHPTIEPTAAASTPATVGLALLAELPPDIRQQIPALTINGAVYSDNPAQRLLLVNGQVLPQGSQAAPDLTLDRIGANSSEFSFRGTRFRVTH